ncbi:hypothetical protein Z043_101686, partial [Scleropages formosus]
MRSTAKGESTCRGHMPAHGTDFCKHTPVEDLDAHSPERKHGCGGGRAVGTWGNALPPPPQKSPAHHSERITLALPKCLKRERTLLWYQSSEPIFSTLQKRGAPLRRTFHVTLDDLPYMLCLFIKALLFQIKQTKPFIQCTVKRLCNSLSSEAEEGYCERNEDDCYCFMHQDKTRIKSGRREREEIVGRPRVCPAPTLVLHQFWRDTGGSPAWCYKMGRHWYLMLCALMGLAFLGLPLNTKAQEAQDSADVVFLIDGSQNVGAGNFPHIRSLALSIIERLAVGKDAIRVAVVQYSTDPQVHFYLNSYDNKAAILDVVKGLNFQGGVEANLGAALKEVAESLLGPEAGGRAEDGIPQVVVVISAGPYSDDVSEGSRALDYANVFVFPLGVGSAGKEELEGIATDKQFMLSAPDFRAIDQQRDPLLLYIIGVAQRTIILETSIPEALDVSKRDIIFLIDGSQSMGATHFNAVRDFIKQFAQSMPISPDQVQVGVAQFTTSQKLEMNLNTHGSREALTAAVAKIRIRGGTKEINTGAAMDFVRTQMLRPERGSRIQQGVPQLLVLVASKKSRDDVVQPAEQLKQMEVLIVAVGSKAADERELNQIATAQSLVHMLRDFRQLSRNPRKLISSLSTLSVIPIHGTEVPTETVTEVTTIQTQRILRDIVFLVDGSNYVGGANLPYVRNFISSVVNQLDVRPDRVRIGLMQFAGSQRTEFFLNTFSNKQDVLDAVGRFDLIGGTTLNTGAALQFALTEHFQPSAGSRKRQKVQQMLVLITAGNPQDEFKRVADQVALAGVMTFAIGIGQVDEDFLRTVAFIPDLAFMESSFSRLENVAAQIMTPLITLEGDTDTVPGPGEATGGERDVAFLIDGSDAVASDFPSVIDFIKRVIEPLDVGSNKIRIAVAQHSETPAPNFYLNTYSTKEEIMAAINGMTPTGGRYLNTGAALVFMRDIIFSPTYGSRAAENVPQFLIVLTGGRSRDNVRDPAVALKTGGVVPFGVGVKNADRSQIEAISYNPAFAFSVKEFSQLNTVQQRLGSYINLPKENLEVILREADMEDTEKDVVFLLDGSDGTENGFPAMRDFVQRVVEKLNLKPNKDRVSVVQYSRDPEAHFYLGSYSTKENALDIIRNLRHKGGKLRNTGTALQFVADNVFSASSGSRRLKGVPQILILLNSGQSGDDIRGPVRALKELGIVPLSIGTESADTLELQMISYNPNYALSISDFVDLPTVQQDILFLIKEASQQKSVPTAKYFESTGKDVVFLLDGSDNTRNDFEGIRSFVKEVVENLNLDDNRDQVAVVQYSSEAAADFTLNSFSSKNNVLSSIKSMKHRGGRPLNTGAALQYVRDNIFTALAGSRSLDGVAQILFVLSGGRSNDDVRRPAQALRERKIKTFGIGVRNADVLELQTIAFTPSYAFSVPDFESLKNIQQKISYLVNDVQEMLPTAPTLLGPSMKRDIVFLIDGSDDAINRFTAIREFVTNVVRKFDVDEKKNQVAVVQYSNTAVVDFYLNTHKTKESTLSAIRNLKPKGGKPQYTGRALDFVKDSVFSPLAGSRRSEGANQILVLLASGSSRDSPTAPAGALRRMGVVTFVIGSTMMDPFELQSVAFQPHYSYAISNFHDLPKIQQNLVERLFQLKSWEDLKVIEDKNQKRDIIFLLDGSDNNRRGFSAMLNFVNSIVENLDVEEKKDRIALIQFSNVAVANFYLNSFFNKENVMRSIKGLSQKGGRPLNTGAALKYVKNNILIPSSGSRHLEGVPQILILLSGGRSSDNIDTPASALKDLGVLTFGIGTRSSDIKELQKISHDPNYILTVPEFSDLPDIREQLLSSINTVHEKDSIIKPTAFVQQGDAKKDVVFMLDGSERTRKEFPAMQDFVQRIVDKLHVNEGNDRVSLVQYSRVPQ